MPLDPQVRTLLDRLAAEAAPPVETQSPGEARRAMAGRTASLPRPEGLKSVAGAAAEGPAGPIPLRVYTPKGDGTKPGLVWFHGGGWVTGDLETHDGLCRALSLASGAVIVAVDYRLAPEHRFPAAVEDASAATRWVAAHAEQLGIDRGRLAVGGDSAGGNLATVVSAIARDERNPELKWQLLVYPITDCDLDTPSYRDNATGYMLTRAAMEWFWSHYAPEPDSRRHPHASPLRSPDLSGLPPAYLITAEYDPLRDEGESYARRLQNAGVRVRLERFDGMVHGFLRRAGQLDRVGVAVRRIAEELQRELTRGDG